MVPDVESDNDATRTNNQSKPYYEEKESQVMVWDVDQVNKITQKGGNLVRRSRSQNALNEEANF